MLSSIALVFLTGLAMAAIFSRLKLPPLVGMLLTGILLGPSVLNALDPALLVVSADLRQMALIIILTRAGLNLNIADLRKVGRPALLMSFIPALLEITGTLLLAPPLLGLTLVEAAMLGTVIAAVSPAVVVPKMLRLMENGYGTGQSIPQMILAAASLDDIFVIVLFTSSLNLAQGGSLDASAFLAVPLAIAAGAAAGALIGLALNWFFRRFHMRDSVKVIIILSTAFLLASLEKRLEGLVPFSGLLAVMTMGMMLAAKLPVAADRLSVKFDKLWVAAELILFVLVGAVLDVRYAAAAGITALILILGVLVFRMLGVWLSLLATNLNYKERLFCLFAYMPKATVQAAIGSVPLALGLPSGEIILTVAVLSILVTAPLGAFLIDFFHPRLLKQETAPD